MKKALKKQNPGQESKKVSAPAAARRPRAPSRHQKEINGPMGPNPTRYGDWERKGRCVDF